MVVDGQAAPGTAIRLNRDQHPIRGFDDAKDSAYRATRRVRSKL